MVLERSSARRLALEHLVEEVPLEAHAVVEALEPAVGVLLEREVAQALHPEAVPLEERAQRACSEVDVVTRDVQVEPRRPREARLEALRVRNGDGEEPAGLEELPGAAHGLLGNAEVLERVPEDDDAERPARRRRLAIREARDEDV